MSAYITVYLKSNANDFIPLGTFSRSTVIFGCLNYVAQYEKNIPLKKVILDEIMDDLEESIKHQKKTIKEFKKELKAIGSWNCSFEEKESGMSSRRLDIADGKEYLESLEKAYGFFRVLRDIYIEADETKFFSNEELHINPETYIWIGYESAYPRGASGNEKRDGEEDF